jgi:GalNAc5-diNAcBac-PP-undecaprenol beta-1,3-glucosyltransferase
MDDNQHLLQSHNERGCLTRYETTKLFIERGATLVNVILPSNRHCSFIVDRTQFDYMEHVKPVITTIIPTYNRSRMLKRAIQSVLDQTYEKLQVCIYDNASEDDTESIVSEMKEKDKRIQYFRHPRNIGPINNFNFGMSRVSTPFFSFLADDDALLPDFYQTALRCFKRHPGILFAAGECLIMQNGKVFEFSTHKEGYYSQAESLLEMVEGMAPYFPVLPAILFRQDVVNKVGLFDAETGAIDIDFEYRTIVEGPFVLFKTPCAVMDRHASSSNVWADYHFFWPGWLKMIKNLTASERLSPRVSARLAKALHRLLPRMIFGLTVQNIAYGRTSGAYGAAELLKREYGLKMYPLALIFLAKTQETRLLMPLLRNIDTSQFIRLLYSLIRKLVLKEKSIREIEKELQPYLKYWELLSAENVFLARDEVGRSTLQGVARANEWLERRD